ncbi:MAG TPA: beta-propeller fold lactonase family protein [Variovorax sp.]|nr:beta-propeller fold lactonase family protein [Variovorax sp.]
MPITVLTRCLLKMTTCLVLAVGLAACGGGGGASGGGGGAGGGGDDKTVPSSHRFSGVVSGLDAGAQLKLKLNDSEALTVSANGPYSFVANLPSNGSYNVTVTQPTGQTCSVANFSGAGVTGDVSNINIVCSTDSFAISGVVSGLAVGAQLTLNNNGSDPLVVSANGTMSFAKPVAHNGSYVVTVDAQPAGQTCTVNNGSGSGVTSNVANVSVVCSTNTYGIGGNVSGLDPSEQVTLKNNGADLRTIGNGPFSFPTPVAHGGNYAVTVGTQPTGKTCTVSNATGSGVTGAIGDVAVHCSAITYSISGSVSGLLAGQQVTLKNNGDDETPVAGNAGFSFATQVAHGGGYAVTVSTQPAGQTCTVSNGTGTNVGAPVTTVAIVCSVRTAYAYVALAGSNEIGQYVIGSDGTLTSMPAVAAGNTPTSIAVDPSGRYAYAANSNGANVSQYAIGSNGSLSPMTTNATVAAGNGALFIAIAPNGLYAYVANSLDDTISQYSIGADGSLTPLASASVSAGDFPRSIAVDPTSRYVYVANYNDGTVSQYSIGTGGALTPMANPTVPVSTAYSVSVGPSGRFAYVASFSGNSVSQFAIDGLDGSLSAVAPAVPTGASPYSIAIDPTGRYAYVPNANDDTVSQYAIDSGAGSLSAMGAGSVTAGHIPSSIALDPTGRFTYVVNAADGNIHQFDVAPADGALTYRSDSGGLSNPQSIVTTNAR